MRPFFHNSKRPTLKLQRIGCPQDQTDKAGRPHQKPNTLSEEKPREQRCNVVQSPRAHLPHQRVFDPNLPALQKPSCLGHQFVFARTMRLLTCRTLVHLTDEDQRAALATVPDDRCGIKPGSLCRRRCKPFANMLLHLRHKVGKGYRLIAHKGLERRTRGCCCQNRGFGRGSCR